MHQNDKSKILQILLALFIVATLAFIWGHSMRSIPESQGDSLSVLERVKPFLEAFVGEGNVTDHLVRKLAHFIEFGVLGAELMLFSAFYHRQTPQAAINCLFAGLSAAVIDETIQIFSQRGSQVQDVLLDFSGCCAGVLLVCFILMIMRRWRILKK